MSGTFITFEGPEGSGKTTQGDLLKTYLENEGYDVLCTREPGGTKIGEELRHLVKNIKGEEAPCVETELLMFIASRAQLMQKVILPHLNKGGIVICDRFADSTTVYQGYARGYDMDRIAYLNQIAVGDRWPNITFHIDIPTKLSHQRQQSRGEGSDRFEDEKEKFYRAVRDGSSDLARIHPDRFRTIDGSRSVTEVHGEIREVISQFLALIK